MKRKQLVFDKLRPVAINEARLEHLATLEPSLNFHNRTVLEVGAGIGQLTYFWEERGCSVTSTDGRSENLLENLKRHPWRVDSLHLADLRDCHSHSLLGQFDIVFAYGILYLVPTYQLPDIIAELAAMTKELFLASMIVQPVDSGTIDQMDKDNPEVPNSSLDGKRSLVARDWFLAELRKRFEFAYITRTQPDDRVFPIKWSTRLKNPRCIFVASRHKLDSKVFSEELLLEQTKAKSWRDYEGQIVRYF